jgi:hypothetical protein
VCNTLPERILSLRKELGIAEKELAAASAQLDATGLVWLEAVLNAGTDVDSKEDKKKWKAEEEQAGRAHSKSISRLDTAYKNRDRLRRQVDLLNEALDILNEQDQKSDELDGFETGEVPQ